MKSQNPITGRNGTFCLSAIAASLLVAVGSVAHAAIVSLPNGLNVTLPTGVVSETGSSFILNNLLPSGGVIPGIVVGDDLFYNFGYTTGGTAMPNVNAVTVLPAITSAPTYGLTFSGVFGDNSTSGPSDALITYEVMALDPSQAILSPQTDADPTVTSAGQLEMDETWTSDGGVSYVKAYDFEPAHPVNLPDSTTFSVPLTHLFVQDHIEAFVPDGGSGSMATVSFLDQLYAPEAAAAVATPEPGSVALLTVGGAFLALRRQKRTFRKTR